MSWPSASDLQARLAAAQVSMPDGSAVPASIASAALMTAAVRRFEEATGWVPFEAASQTRSFDPPSGGSLILPLAGGLLSVSSLTVRGQSLTEGEDFWLQRSRPDMPAWGVRFLAPPGGPAQAIEIEGEWGRMEEADELAREAVLNLAAQMAVRAVADGYLSAPEQWREADVSESFSAASLGALGTGFASMAEPVIALFRRVTVGF